MAVLRDFSKKKCLPCEGIGRAMTKKEAQVQMKNLSAWSLADNGKSIERRYVLKNFVEAVDKINRIKVIAEKEKHHPDLHLTGYKFLTVILSTHAVGGVTQNDLILAAKIDKEG